MRSDSLFNRWLLDEISVAWYTVILLSISYLVAIIDRVILSMVVVSIKSELLLSDTEMGLLLGTAFGLFYSLMGLPMGRLVDRFSRRNLIIVGLLGWSLMTIASGLAGNFWQLFGARMGVGIGEAILAPAAWSMIADLFPHERRAKPLGVFYIGGSVGIGLAMVASSLFLRAASSSALSVLPLLGGMSTWRLVMVLVGLPGIVMALVLLTVREPKRATVSAPTREGSRAAHPTIQEVAAYVWTHRAGLLPFYVGMGFMALTAYSTISWAPTAMVRAFGRPITEIGYWYGLVVMIVTPIATPLGGFVTDRQTAKLNNRIYIRLLIGCLLGVASGQLLFGLSSGLPASLLALGIFNFSYYVGQAPAAGYSLRAAPGNMHGLVSALYVMIINLIGLACGPPLVALVSNIIDPSGQSLRLALSATCMGSALLGVACLLMARRHTYRLFDATGS